MTRLESVRMAWGATAGAVAAAWLYLTAQPSMGSFWVDNLASLVVVLAGAAGAAMAERRIDRAIRSRLAAGAAPDPGGPAPQAHRSAGRQRERA